MHPLLRNKVLPLGIPPTPHPPIMNRRDAAILEGEMDARWPTLRFLWYKRIFALFSDSSFCQYDGAELRHSATITQTTSVSN